MTVYDSGDWFKCKKEIIRDENISQSAKWLYIVLTYHNNFFGKQGFFTRTNADLMKDAGMSEKTLKKAKAELKEAGYIECWKNNLYRNSDHDKLTTFRICCYRILK